MQYAYPAVLKRENGSVSIVFPDVRGAHTFGGSRAEALRHAVDALETALSLYIDERKPLPKPGRLKRGQVMVRVSPLGQAKLGLYEAMRAQGIGRAALARRLDCHLAQIDRLLDLCHASKLEQLERALAAVGKRITLAIADAAD
ncbi:MAG: type II toxin-antitoxin system HicB family antitoxin [Alphaproteobacteria bacterium]|nr:type II toxin-antitoxin system HicB family antitoxin [Alphaproteobacteria bacterium]